MYSPKIKDDLIPIIYRKSKISDKPMTEFVDEILRSELIEESEEDIVYNCCNCRKQVEVVDGDKGYCDHCEGPVFIEKV